MKQKFLLKIISTLFLLLLSLPLLFSQVRGNGNLEKQERSVSDFNGIEVRSGIDLHISQGDQSKVVIETDENLQEYIITEVESGVLHIYVQKDARIYRINAMDAYITVNQLNSLKVTGGGDVQSQGMISAEDISMAISGGGDLQFNLKAMRARCEISGGGAVNLEADIREFKLEIGGGGDLQFDGDLGLLDLSMSGGGDATVHGHSEAEGVIINMAGGGDLELEIECEKIKVSSSGGGDILAGAGFDVSQAGFSLTGGGDLSLEIGAGDLSVSMGGGGDATLKGSASKLACEIKSGGNLEAQDFRVKAAKIDLTGGSNARIHVDEELLLNATGGAQIYLSGEPHIDANLTGGAKIHRK